MTIGAVLMLMALALLVYDRWEANQAENSSNNVIGQMGDDKPDYEPDDTVSKFASYIPPKGGIMPTKTIDGYEYIGTLEIPKFGLKLPVMSAWSYPGLRIAPGRYTGSVWTKDLVICGHNYERHFGNLRYLEEGDTVIFTDVLNNVFEYEVALVETLAPTDVSKMTSSSWDLTLFTCTIGGASRVTVRCMLTEECYFDFQF